MGVIEQTESGRRITLGSRCLFGRHHGCDVRLDDPRISGEHASLYWLDGRWELRDLGSRNGTFVEGRRLAAGEREALAMGMRFFLGSPKLARTFALLDMGPPAAVARQANTSVVRTAAGGLLVLPSDDRPLVSIVEHAGGGWLVEIGDSTRPIADQETLVVDGEAWIVELPVTSSETWAPSSTAPSLETIHLRLGVSRNEEYVEVSVIHAGTTTELRSRSFHYLLVTLARASLADAGAPESERGWMDREVLCRMLGVDSNKLNVDLHRARKQFGELGVKGAANLIERRPGAGQLRLGLRSVEVFTL